MPPTPRTEPRPLVDADIERLQRLLDRLPAPLEPPDAGALDGYLCGVLLQPGEVPAADWLPWVADVHGRPLPAGHDAAPLHGLVRRRHEELRRAIAARQWFDPWVFAEAGDGPEAVVPWVAGFAAALERVPQLADVDDERLLEPLALLYLHLGHDALPDIEGLAELVDTLEPAQDVAEAVQDLVRCVMLIADVVQPRAVPAKQQAPGAG
jgi:uncharacterized protein